jgi:CCR4-NOT transcription complex subunit 2
MPTSRSPQGPNGVATQEKEVRRPSTYPAIKQNKYTDDYSVWQLQQRQPQGEAQETSASGQSAEQPPLSQMSELDRFGLAGLLRMIHSESPDVASLAVGQDLMTLGLDLNQPEYD